MGRLTDERLARYKEYVTEGSEDRQPLYDAIDNLLEALTAATAREKALREALITAAALLNTPPVMTGQDWQTCFDDWCVKYRSLTALEVK